MGPDKMSAEVTRTNGTHGWGCSEMATWNG